MKKDMFRFIELVELIEKNDKMYEIFKECPYDILRSVRVRTYPKNAFVLEQGEIHDTFYIIVKGNVDIYAESEQGKKYFLAQYGDGQYIGEMEIFGRRPYVSRAESKGEVTMLEIDRDRFLTWVQKDQNFSTYLIKTFSASAYAMCKNMGENALYSLKQRICQYLLSTAEQTRAMEIPLKSEMLGSMLAVTQRSANRVLKQLKEEGIIELSPKGVVIKDYEALLRGRDMS